MKKYFSLLTSHFSFLLVFVSAFLPWIDSPIGPDYYGPGQIAAGIAVFGLILHFSESGKGIAGATGIALALFSVLHLALFDPFLRRLLIENSQYARILKFSEAYLPPNLSTEPDFQSAVNIGTVWNLLETALYFSGPGLWCCTAGSLLMLISEFRNSTSLRLTMAGLLLCIFIQLAVFSYGASAQRLAEKGDRLMTNGDYAEAIRIYETALKTAMPAIADRLYLHIGEAYIRLCRPDHPAALFYQGICYERDGASDSAVRVWLRAREISASSSLAESPVLLKTVLSEHIARTYIETGLLSYQKKEISQAVILWEKALNADPDQIQAIYYLSRAYFDQADYRKSIERGRNLLSLSRNKLLNADTLANMGDSYWKLHDFSAARRAYQAALKLDPSDNARIVKALGGT